MEKAKGEVIEKKWECEICNRLFAYRKARGNHYLRKHLDDNRAFDLARRDDVDVEEFGHYANQQSVQVNHPLPQLVPSSSSSYTSTSTNPPHHQIPHIHIPYSSFPSVASSYAFGNNGNVTSSLKTVPNDGGSSGRNERMEDRVVILKNIRGAMTREKFKYTFLQTTSYKRFDSFLVASSTFPQPVTTSTTGQIEFYTANAASNFQRVLSAMSAQNGFGMVVELASKFLPNPHETINKPLANATTSSELDESLYEPLFEKDESEFILLEGAPQHVSSADVGWFFYNVLEYFATGITVIRNKEGLCSSGKVVCRFRIAYEATIAVICLHHKLLLGSKVSVRLISMSEMLLLIPEFNEKAERQRQLDVLHMRSIAARITENWIKNKGRKMDESSCTTTLTSTGNQPSTNIDRKSRFVQLTVIHLDATFEEIHIHIQRTLQQTIDKGKMHIMMPEKTTQVVYLEVDNDEEARVARNALQNSLFYGKGIISKLVG